MVWLFMEQKMEMERLEAISSSTQNWRNSLNNDNNNMIEEDLQSLSWNRLKIEAPLITIVWVLHSVCMYVYVGVSINMYTCIYDIICTNVLCANYATLNEQLLTGIYHNIYYLLNTAWYSIRWYSVVLPFTVLWDSFLSVLIARLYFFED